ncbi:fibrous sheath CABYR-binding protein [Agrilus planipennis]|uniref:Fibrous sheath CABYR-binding protein n=1 Tax=Agrilus planipennis TaxID=224129 RepID=A0A1W4W660_AGRPL|nr:fibrous sheath CABYR-binding protein [Agrilus planipennis]XP_018319599.1 fibrous sheath CABYR-binding protein [Agrilus planipennis]
MAKKGQAVQFQTELNSDEDWEKFIAREGLLIIDIYSEWAGPCSSMAPNLKKVKLEIGGDLVQMAIANNENIEILKRFRGKSEPTWMFVAGGKMVGITFGANAPKLNKFIAEEIKREEACLKGERERIMYEFEEFIGEERERWEAEQEIIKAAEAIETAKREKQKLEWRTIVAENCLENFPDYGCAILFPQCKVEAKPVVADALQQNGINLFKEEPVQLTEQMIEEILYFSEMTFLDEEVEVLLKDRSSILLLKPSVAELPAPVDQVVLQAIYGLSKQPPGDPDSPALQFFAPLPPPPKEKKTEGGFEGLGDIPLGLPGLGLLGDEEEAPVEEEQEEEVEEEELGPPVTGVWAPPNSYTRAFIIKNCFPKLHASIALEEPQPTPPHLAIAFDAFRRREILELVENYPNEVLRYGFFTSEDPDKAQLIAKNVRKFEQLLAKKVPTYEERLVIQLSKKKSEAVLAFITVNPTRVSNNVVDGEEECKKFFPEGYDEPIEEEVVEEEKPKKKKKKKAKEGGEEAATAASVAEAEEGPEEGGEEGGAEGEEGGDESPTEVGEGGEAPPPPAPTSEAPPVVQAPPPPPTEVPPPAEAAAPPTEAPPPPPAEAPPPPAEEADKATSPIPEE